VNPIEIAMTTVDTRPMYVKQTLEALFAQPLSCGPVRVVVDGDDAAYLGEWRSRPELKVELLSRDAAAAQRELHVIDRCTFTTHRALSGATRGSAVVLLQDDVIFAPGWFDRMVDTIHELEADVASENYVLALYSTYPFTRKPYSIYPRHDFFGCQGLYFSPVAAPLIANVLATHFAECRARGDRPGGADDVIMNKYFIRHAEPYLLAMVPSVVQHVGRDGTGVSSGWFHCSPTFEAEKTSG